jgi:hypothetical protein
MRHWEQKFTVVEESDECGEGVRDCPAVHWVCPFCGGRGSTKERVPEYFSVSCDRSNRVFLVHSAAERAVGAA